MGGTIRGMSRRATYALPPALVGILGILTLSLITIVGYSHVSPPPLVNTQTAQVPLPPAVLPQIDVSGEVLVPPRAIPVPARTEAPKESGVDIETIVGEHAIVRSVMDGDTIEVEMNGRTERVRYIGIDTPETVHPSKPVQCFGKEASAKNKALVLGKEIVLMSDVTNRDKYGRLLRYVYLDGTLINEQLVREGYAYAYRYPPDTHFDARFTAAEQKARAQGAGLWGSVCESYTPESVPVSAYVPDGCTIKGNVSAKGDKIYHVPGCKLYEKTVIKEEVGERWFCSEQEALGAGWRKALNC